MADDELFLYNISLKVLQCRVGEGQYEEDVVVTMLAERQNVVLRGQHGDDGSLPGRGQHGDPEPGLREILAVSMKLSPTKQREGGIHKVQLLPTSESLLRRWGQRYQAITNKSGLSVLL